MRAKFFEVNAQDELISASAVLCFLIDLRDPERKYIPGN